MNYIVEGEILTSLANVIREKISSTEKLVFPDEFEAGIKSLGNLLLILPELDMNYPLDLTVNLVDGEINATFSSSIKTQGVPSKYTYTWYLDGQVVPEATGAVFTKSGAIEAGEHTVYYEITNDAGTVTSRIAKLIVYSVPVLDANYPKDVTAIYGKSGSTSANFNILISSEGEPSSYTYQWYYDEQIVQNATSSSYTISNLATEGVHTVYCKVTNAGGTITSRTATLTVVQKYLPELNNSYPQDATAVYGKTGSASANFNVSISSEGKPSSYTYQWYMDGVAVSGATSASYTAANLATEKTHEIYCKVTNEVGTVISRKATLTVVQRYVPVLDGTLPKDTTVYYGKTGSTSATFNVSMTTAGKPTSYTYKWYYDGNVVSGATSASYTVSNLETEGTHTVYCEVTNAAGTVKSRTATLTVGQRYTPVLNSSLPTDTTVYYGKTGTAEATFTVSISTAGKPTSYTYQWYLNGNAVSGATGTSYKATGLTEGSNTVYCKVTNSAGAVTSRTATLMVIQQYIPVLNTSYPKDVSFVEGNGSSASFSVIIATDGKPDSYTYQRYWNNSAVSGATSSSYTRTGLTSTGTHTAYCKVTNAAGTVTSRTATVSINSCKPTYTYSGAETFTDEGNYNWNIQLKTSGTFKFTSLGNAASGIDVFCVGGGGGGACAGGGGGGGRTTTGENKTVSANTNYTVTIGSGGSGGTSSSKTGGTGGTTSAFDVSASGGNGGRGATGTYGTFGGAGGSGGGAWGGCDGGSNGSDGEDLEARYPGGAGQGSTTRAFGESSGTLYAGGGGGGNYFKWGSGGGAGGAGGGGAGGSSPKAGTTNTGGGGGGSHDLENTTDKNGGAGGSGIVIIRNRR